MGHDPSGGRGNICVYNENGSEMLFIIECKTAGKEYKKAYNDTLADGGQIFSYWQQEGATKWLALYTSELADNKIDYKCPVISCADDPNFIIQSKKDASVHLYTNANTAKETSEGRMEMRKKLDIIWEKSTLWESVENGWSSI